MVGIVGYGWWEDWQVAQAMAKVRAAEGGQTYGGRDASPTITYAEFSGIRTGMYLSEVVALVGHPGQQASYSEVPPIEGLTSRIIHTAQQWENADGSNALVMFENGKVISKAQAGL